MLNIARSTLFLSAGFFFFAGASMAQQHIGIGVAYQDVQGFEDPGTSLIVNYAAPVTASWALQGELTSSVAYAEQDVSNGSGASIGFRDFYALSAGLYALYRHRLSEQFFLSGRAGAVYLGSEEETCITGTCTVEEKDPKLSFSYGLAAGLQISSVFGLQLQWTVLNADVRHTGLMLEWRF